ncbi:MAG: putative F420-dependent oxidoreductase [Verrucomicrobiales bacterium]|jgi:probable F420-dependent oxidoreductase
MPSPFRFGVQAMDFGDPSVLRALALLAESLGYDELFTADHLGAPDPFIPLMLAAEATTTLRVGPLVINNELYHPALLARTAASLDALSGGRLVLGLGTGYMQSEHDAMNIVLRPPAERVDRFEESVTALRFLLDDGRAEVDGAHHTLSIDDLGIAPSQPRVPFLIGGHGRRVVGIAGRHADIYQFTGLTHGAGGAPEPGGFRFADLRQRSGWLEAAAGDRADQIERSALVQRVVIGIGAEIAAAEASAGWGLDRGELEDCPFGLFGSVEQVVDKLYRLRDSIGISHYVIRDVEGFAPIVDVLGGR